MADWSNWVAKKFRRIVKQHPCPTCKAKAGYPCTNTRFYSDYDENDRPVKRLSMQERIREAEGELIEPRPLSRKRRQFYQNYVHRSRGA